MKIIKDTKKLRDVISQYRKTGKKIVLVPTMGALHDGHLSLVKLARNKADLVIASIFVNPAQFGPNEDFSRYPRQEKKDLEMLKEQEVDAVFLPDAKEIYPDGFSTKVTVEGISKMLEGAFRPQFFDGVATVVAKLLMLVQPDIAIFGEKDYQQLVVIRKMVRELNMPVEVIGGKTVREKDGLAMSSRNQYLNKKEREIATALYRILTKTADRIKSGREKVPDILAWSKEQLVKEGFSKVDYVELCDASTLQALEKKPVKPARVLAAAFLSKTRLIDNIAL